MRGNVRTVTTETTVETYWARIYLSGPLDVIKHVCRDFCWSVGLCVNVAPTKFIYTGGEETGAIVELVNYPRFPKEPNEIDAIAKDLAKRLRDETKQRSVMTMNPMKTTWITEESP